MQSFIKKAIRFTRRAFIAIAIAVTFWSVVTMVFEQKFIFFPDKFPIGWYDESAQVAGLVDCWPVTDDGVKLHGWFLPADSAIATLVIAHGNAGNISHRLDLLEAIRRTGFNVFMFDYRGYGRSEGSPGEEGIYRDGVAAFDYARGLPGVDSQRIVFWGTSLGGAVAVEVATCRSIAALVLESTFTSAKDVATFHYPFLPSRYLLRTKLNSIDKISRVHVPLLMMHGRRDRVIPFKLGRELFTAANEPKEFYEIPGADHNDTYIVGGSAYFRRVRDFISNHLPQRHR